jgi:TP901 family phage tail tape measure protein
MGLFGGGTSFTVGIALGVTGEVAVGNAIRGTLRESNRLGAAIGRSDRRAIRMGRALERLKREQYRTRDASEGLRRRIDRLGEAFAQAKRRARGLRDEQRKLLGAAAAAARGRLGQTWAAATGVAATGYTVGRLVGGALERERATARLGHAVSGEDHALAVQQSRAAVRRGRVLHDERELLGIQFAFHSSGLEAETARAATEVASQLASVTDGAPERAAEVMSVVVNTLGDSLEGDAVQRMRRIGDLLTHQFTSYTADSFDQIGEAMVAAAPAAAMAGTRVRLEDLTVALGVFADAGRKGSEGGTAMAGALAKLVPASQELGFAIARDAEGYLDLPATIDNVRESLQSYGDLNERELARQKAFGEEGARYIEPLLSGVDKLRAGMAAEKGGLLDREFGEELERAGGQIQVFRNNTTLLGDAIGDVFKVRLAEGAASLTPFVGRLGAAVQESQSLQTWIVRATLGVGGFLAATVGVAFGRFAWLRIAQVWVGVTRATGLATAAQWAYNAAVRAGSGGRLPTTRRARTAAL